jgi:cobalamin biosynthesis Mg chelatase CobN
MPTARGARCAGCSRRRSRWTTPSSASTTRACRRACRNARPPAARGHQRARGTVGLLLLRSYLLAGNAGHYDGVITALEARGLRVLPVFATGLDARPAIEKFFFDAGRPPLVDAVVSLTGFSLVGGPAYNDARAAEEILAGWTCPTWP